MQGELFNPSDYTFLCSSCRREFPRSIEFFPVGRCKDKLASFCRKCSNYFPKRRSDSKDSNIRIEKTHSREKICLECGETKVLREFYMSSHTLDGKTTECKICIDSIHSEIQVHQKYFNGFSWGVYFIQDSRNKRVKIGFSEDPEQTLFYLQEGSSEDLILLAIHDSGDKDQAENDTRILHSLFKSHHKGNNWFEMVSPLEQYILLLNRTNNERARILKSDNVNKEI